MTHETRGRAGPPDFELRYFQGDVALRQASDDEETPPVIVGYAALFDTLSDDLGGFREKIDRGAFAKTMGADIRALFNHEPSQLLGRTKNKTLRIDTDNRGLRIEITPPDTAIARDVVALVGRGDVNQMSFGFRTLADKWERDRDTNEMVRTLLDVTLIDVSPVTYAAYPQTEIALRSLDAWRAEQLPPPPDFNVENRLLDLARLQT